MVVTGTKKIKKIDSGGRKIGICLSRRRSTIGTTVGTVGVGAFVGGFVVAVG